MAKLFLYIFVILLVVYALDAVNINGIFKKSRDSYYRARIMYMFIVMIISYLLVSFIFDFLGVFN